MNFVTVYVCLSVQYVCMYVCVLVINKPASCDSPWKTAGLQPGLN